MDPDIENRNLFYLYFDSMYLLLFVLFVAFYSQDEAPDWRWYTLGYLGFCFLHWLRKK